jgi:hypothetical protein
VAIYVGDRMSGSDRLAFIHSSQTLASARRALAEAPAGVAVVLDEQGNPLTVVAARDLAAIEANGETPLAELLGGLPPGLLTIARATLEEFVSSPEFTAFYAGVRGALVFDGNTLLGVLTRETIARFLDREFRPLDKVKALSPWLTRLDGDILTPPIKIHCQDFNHLNELEEMPEESPLCASEDPHPHPIWR